VKSPADYELGRSIGILNNEMKVPENGHVPRNVRLTLAAIDLVQPYVCISKVNETDISWYVGGAVNVDSTFIQLVQNSSIPLQPNTIDRKNSAGLTSLSLLKTERVLYTSKLPEFSHLSDGEYLIIAWAKVDSNWGADSQVRLF
jgi:hypothetical protein